MNHYYGIDKEKLVELCKKYQYRQFPIQVFIESNLDVNQFIEKWCTTEEDRMADTALYTFSSIQYKEAIKQSEEWRLTTDCYL